MDFRFSVFEDDFTTTTDDTILRELPYHSFDTHLINCYLQSIMFMKPSSRTFSWVSVVVAHVVVVVVTPIAGFSSVPATTLHSNALAMSKSSIYSYRSRFQVLSAASESDGDDQLDAPDLDSSDNNIDDNDIAGSIAPSASPPTASKREMLGFALPALGIYLSNPLLSNIDNAFVGKTVGTAGLAALSPATVAVDQMLYLFSFLSRATTVSYSRKIYIYSFLIYMLFLT